ncbi:MAG: ATP-binding protein, partial [Candidatus Aenigmatarchaeota archaeon]
MEVRDLRKSFGEVKAVDGISFHVEEGELFGFLGPNGAGKTTTVRLLTGVLRPDGGEVRIMGSDISEDPLEVKMSMGIVPEMSNPYIDLSVWDNLMLMGELYGVPRRVRRQRAQQLLTEFGLWERRNDRARTLSKGMRQRLLLAMA